MARTQYVERSDLEEPDETLAPDVVNKIVGVVLSNDTLDQAAVVRFIDDLATNGVEALKSRGFITAADMHQAFKSTMRLRRLEMLTRLQWEAARHASELKAIMQLFDY